MSLGLKKKKKSVHDPSLRATPEVTALLFWRQASSVLRTFMSVNLPIRVKFGLFREYEFRKFFILLNSGQPEWALLWRAPDTSKAGVFHCHGDDELRGHYSVFKQSLKETEKNQDILHWKIKLFHIFSLSRRPTIPK